MARKTRIQRELEKKQLRRTEELKLLQDFKMKLHSPVSTKKPAEFKFEKNKTESFEYPAAIGNTVLEKKSDGYCVHLSIDHKCSEKIKIYSSNSNEWNPKCFPEVLEDLLKLPSGYYHGELLGLKPEHAERFRALDEFIAIEKRPKTSTKSLTKELIKKYPLKLDIFDVLMMENKCLLSKPLQERRALLEDRVDQTSHVKLIQQWKVTDKKQMQQLFLWAVDDDCGYEGLIAKDPLSFYVPGSRNSDWIKLKEFITLDLAVLGFYETEERRKAGKPFSAVLVGSYNTKTKNFETMAKVKVGKREDQMEIYKLVNKTFSDYKKTSNIKFNPSMSKIKRKIPAKLVEYDSNDVIILEIQILDVTYSDNWHSCGFDYDGKKAHSLRLPTFKQLRKDKTRTEHVTTTQQIHDYYLG